MPWSMSEAPDDSFAVLLKGMVGFEIPVARLEGKWKMSQNRNEADRLGAVRGWSMILRRCNAGKETILFRLLQSQRRDAIRLLSPAPAVLSDARETRSAWDPLLKNLQDARMFISLLNLVQERFTIDRRDLFSSLPELRREVGTVKGLTPSGEPWNSSS